MVSLVALWIFATSLSAGAALSLLATQTNYDQAGRPAEAVVGELQRERRLSLGYLGSGRIDRGPLTDQRPRTDAAIAEFRTRALSERMQDASTDQLKQRLRDVFEAADALTAGRRAMDLGQLGRAEAMALFGRPIDLIYQMYLDLRGIDDATVGKDSRTVIALSRAREVLAQQDALLGGVAAAGRFQGTEHTDLVLTIGAQRFLFAEAAVNLPPAEAITYQAAISAEPAMTLRSLEDRLIAEARANGPVPIDMTVWRDRYEQYVERLRALEFQAGDAIVAKSRPIGLGIFAQLGAAAVLGLIAVLVSVLLSVRIGRSLVQRLTGLRHAAQELADHRLPDVVRKLRRGEEIDEAAEAPALEYGTDEIGAVGNAFSAVQRNAVASAVQEARLRRGLNEVFLNIARRSQTLVHRQLSLLDRMERRTSDAEELEDLFRVDHLATRMRRHAEDLVILAGAAPGRGWRQPVPMVDVIRGAVSEVEDYARVTFQAIPEAALAGRAVADVIHLVAELVENATSYSPPHTKVVVAAQLVPNGFVIEIEDRGLGMAQEDIDEANQRLANPPDFDPVNSARLGLFVVALLAARHRIRVTLRTSPYGGIAAVLLIPTDLISGAGAEMSQIGLPARPVAAVSGGDHVPDDPRSTVLTLDAADISDPVASLPQRRGRVDQHSVDRDEQAIKARAHEDHEPRAHERNGHEPGRREGRLEQSRTGLDGVNGRRHPPGDGSGYGGLDVRRAEFAAEHHDTPPEGPRHAVLPQRNGRDSGAAIDGMSWESSRSSTWDPVTVDSPTTPTTVGSEASSGELATRASMIAGVTSDGLPRRRRQASLAPQLRGDRVEDDDPSEVPTGGAGLDGGGRTPEQIRRMMSSFQSGMARGRRDAAAAADAGEAQSEGDA